jgi:hypothetical protein
MPARQGVIAGDPTMPAKKQEAHAIAFFNLAGEYHDAANELFVIADARQQTKDRRKFDSPVYLLYFHTIELALKAFLRTHNKTRKHHNLTKLYSDSRDLGLVIGSQDKFQIGNIVSLLDSANKDQGLRYFNLGTVTTADLPWVREVTAELMRAVEPHVLVRPEQGHLKPDGKFIITFSKPIPKTGV